MMAVVGVVSGLLGSQLRGRVQTESDPGFVTDFQWTGIIFSSGSSPTIAFACPVTQIWLMEPGDSLTIVWRRN